MELIGTTEHLPESGLYVLHADRAMTKATADYIGARWRERVGQDGSPLIIMSDGWTIETIEAAAERACDAAGGPPWDELDAIDRERWIAIARAVLDVG